MRIKKYLNFDNLIFLVTLVALVFILYWRFKTGLIRFFDVDEFAHLFRAWLMADGKIPYKDFGYFYSLVFAPIFTPLFRIFPEQAGVIFLARSIQFLIFSAAVFLVFLIGKNLRDARTGAMSAFLLAFLPLAFDKTLEIRPDTFCLVFWLASILFLIYWQKQHRWWQLFLSGSFLGIALVVLIKIAFALPVFLFFLIYYGWKNKPSLFKNLLVFGFGLLLPWLGFFLILAFLGVLSRAVYLLFLMPFELTRSYGEKYFVPLFPFKPNDVFYGVGGHSWPWVLNTLILITGLVGILKSKMRLIYSISLLSFAFSLFFVFKVTLAQYYLPLLFVLVMGAGELMSGFLAKKPFLWLIMLGVLTFGFWQTARVHFLWTNDHQVAAMNRILSISKPNDYFFDMTGMHLFRPSGYYWCCEFFSEWEDKLSQKQPRLKDELERTQTEYIIQSKRLGSLSPADQNYINENYIQAELPAIWRRK